jgi:hypothetical protein
MKTLGGGKMIKTRPFDAANYLASEVRLNRIPKM